MATVAPLAMASLYRQELLVASLLLVIPFATSRDLATSRDAFTSSF